MFCFSSSFFLLFLQYFFPFFFFYFFYFNLFVIIVIFVVVFFSLSKFRKLSSIVSIRSFALHEYYSFFFLVVRSTKQNYQIQFNFFVCYTKLMHSIGITTCIVCIVVVFFLSKQNKKKKKQILCTNANAMLKWSNRRRDHPCN